MLSEEGPDSGTATLAERAVRRRVAGVEEAAQSDVRALMDAGLALMVGSPGKRGLPRVADIVAAAGLSNDAFYRYFAGKDELVAAIVDEGARTVVSYVRHQVEAVATPEERIRAGVAAVMRQASDAELARQTRAVLGNATVVPPGARHVSVALVESLAEFFAAPAAELGAPDPVRTARAIATSAVAAMQHCLFRGEVPDDEDLAHLVGFLLAGAARDADGASTPR